MINNNIRLVNITLCTFILYFSKQKMLKNITYLPIRIQIEKYVKSNEGQQGKFPHKKHAEPKGG